MVLFLRQYVYLLGVMLEDVGDDAEACRWWLLDYCDARRKNLITDASSTTRNNEDFPLEIGDVGLGVECIAAAKHLDELLRRLLVVKGELEDKGI